MRRSCAATTASTRSSCSNALGEAVPARRARTSCRRPGRLPRADAPTSRRCYDAAVARRAGYVAGANRPDSPRGRRAGRDSGERVDVRTRRGGRHASTATRSASSRRSRSATSSSSARATPSRWARPTSTRTAREQPIVMGSYGIGPARIAAAAVEQFADEQGISWPRALAPWDVELVALGKAGTPERDGRRARSTRSCATAGLEVLLRRPRRRRRARSSPTPSCSAARCA